MKSVKTIVESESNARKPFDQQQKIAELERIIGQKQFLIDFQAKMMELAEQKYGIDIKKTERKPLSGTGSKWNNPVVA